MGYEVVDLAGTAAAMEALYRRTDLHIGYRVHAHILRSSLRRPSVLLAEDARGYGAGQALDSPWLTSLRLQRVRGRLLKYRGHGAGAMMPVADLPAELDALLDDQEAAGWPYLKRLPALQERHMEICRRAVATWP